MKYKRKKCFDRVQYPGIQKWFLVDFAYKAISSHYTFMDFVQSQHGNKI